MPSEFWKMKYWEFEACNDGYNNRYRTEDYKMARQAIWTGNLKKGTTINKLLGYDPAPKAKKKSNVNKKFKCGLGPELSNEEVLKRLAKIKKGK